MWLTQERDRLLDLNTGAEQQICDMEVDIQQGAAVDGELRLSTETTYEDTTSTTTYGNPMASVTARQRSVVSAARTQSGGNGGTEREKLDGGDCDSDKQSSISFLRSELQQQRAANQELLATVADLQQQQQQQQQRKGQERERNDLDDLTALWSQLESVNATKSMQQRRLLDLESQLARDREISTAQLSTLQAQLATLTKTKNETMQERNAAVNNLSLFEKEMMVLKKDKATIEKDLVVAKKEKDQAVFDITASLENELAMLRAKTGDRSPPLPPFPFPISFPPLHFHDRPLLT